ncbi:hypothetical protein ACSBR2_033574 [Camellia fascicularis]
MARVPLICFDVVEWHLPDRVLRQFGRVQSVPNRCDTEWRLHATDRRGRAGTDWSVHHMQYIQLWDARCDSIVQADWSDGVLPSLDPYMLWYRQHTHLLVGNLSHLSEAGYQGVGPSLEALVTIIHAHRVDHLHFGDYGVHSAATAPDTSVPSTSVPPTSAPPTAGPWISVTPPHYTPYISPDSPHVHLIQHADPDWTPPRFMHDVVTLPTQLPPAFLGTTSTAPMSTHDAVLTDISNVDDEAHIEPPPEREREAEVMIVGGRHGRGRDAGRGRGRGPAADCDTVAPNEGVSQLTAVSDLQAETGSGAADTREGGVTLTGSTGSQWRAICRGGSARYSESLSQKTEEGGPRSGLWDWGQVRALAVMIWTV